MGCILARNQIVTNRELEHKQTSSESYQPIKIPHVLLRIRKNPLLVLKSIDEVSAYLEDSHS